MDKFKTTINAPRCARIKSARLVSVGLICGFLGSYGWAAMAPPTEHKGLVAEVLGYVPDACNLPVRSRKWHEADVCCTAP